MTTYLLVEIADDGTATTVQLTDPVAVTATVAVKLADLLPQPAPAPADPPAPVA